MPKIFVKPAVEGIPVRHPKKLAYVIKPEGEWVVPNRDWERMLLQGDVVMAVPPAEAEQPAAKKEKRKKDEKEFKQSAVNQLDNPSKEGEENEHQL